MVMNGPREECLAGTIVCAITGSADGGGAAQFGAALSARLRLRLVLVHVIDGDALPPNGRGLRAAERTGAIAQELGDDVEARVAAGPRAETLAQVAAEEGADLIVVGSRPAGLGGRGLRSTLARELEAATPIPVLVAPPSTRRRSGHRLAVAVEVAGR